MVSQVTLRWRQHRDYFHLVQETLGPFPSCYSGPCARIPTMAAPSQVPKHGHQVSQFPPLPCPGQAGAGTYL